MLPRSFEPLERQIAPGLVVARAQVLEQHAIGLEIGIEEVILGGQERVRPARRRHEHDAPWALAQDARGEPPELEAPARRGRRRVRFFSVLRTATLVADDVAPVAVHRHR